MFTSKLIQGLHAMPAPGPRLRRDARKQCPVEPAGLGRASKERPQVRTEHGRQAAWVSDLTSGCLFFSGWGAARLRWPSYLHDKDAHPHRAEHMLVVIEPHLHLFIATLGSEDHKVKGLA